jgi:hypothetical protein
MLNFTFFAITKSAVPPLSASPPHFEALLRGYISFADVSVRNLCSVSEGGFFMEVQNRVKLGIL